MTTGETGPEEGISRERESTPRMILEIGTINVFGHATAGYRPSRLHEGDVVITADLPRKYTFFDDYFCKPVDLDSLGDIYKTAAEKERQKGLEVPNFSHQAIIMDGRDLLFPAEKIDRVVFNDVIGDPSLEFASMKRFIDEALRVLKIGGEIWVFDDRASSENLSAFEGLMRGAAIMNGEGYTFEDLGDFSGERAFTDVKEKWLIYEKK